MQSRAEPQLRSPFRVAIEGNIGSGKSSLLKYFARFQDVEGVEEAVHEWCDVRGHNLLGLLYEDPKRYCFMFQHYIQQVRTEMHTRPTGKKVKLIERSLQNNRYCFAELAYKSGNLTDEEFAVLGEWYSWLESKVDIHLDLIVYLRTEPDTVYQRMKSRARPEEKGVPFNYIRDLHQSYEDWLINPHKNGIKKSTVPASVLILDANQGLPKMAVEYEKLRTILDGKIGLQI